MSSSKTFAISKDTLLAKTGSTALGGGADPHLPVGYWSGYHFRAALAFSLDWTGVTKVLSATLHLKTTGQVHVGFGGSPDMYVRRLTASFSENSSKSSSDGGSGWGTGASNYDDVTSWTTTGQATKSVTTSESTWVSVDITSIVEDWAPTTILDHTGAACAGASNYGIILMPVTDGSSSETTEFYGQESSYDPYITLTYESNTAPNAPTLTSPVGGTRVADMTPALAFTHSDPQGDACASYDIEVDNNSDFSSPIINVSGQTSGISGTHVTYTASDLSAYRGSTLYWRARTTDPAGLTGAWSSSGSFKLNQLPTVTKVSPAASGLAHITNLASDLNVWTSAGSHATVRYQWTFSDADGDTQSAYRLRLYDAASGGSLIGDSGKTSTSSTTHNGSLQHVLGTAYYWTIEVWDAYGESSGESSRTGYKVRWGQAIYEYAPTGGASSSGWDYTASGAPANTQQAFLFASATGASGAGRSAWKTSPGALAPKAYVNILVRLSSDVTGTQPTLDTLTFKYVGSAIQPDKWVFSSPTTDWGLDSSVRRYGSQSLRCTVSTTSGNRYAYPYTKTSGDDIVVQASTEYTLSAFVKTDAVLASGAKVYLRVEQSGGGSPLDGADGTLVSTAWTTDTSPYPDGWQRLTMTFTTPAGTTRVRPLVYYLHNGTTSGDAFWVDALKLEEGTVATAWTPGFVGDPVVLDSGGVAVDGNAGGIFRLRGSSGGNGDTIELGADGLVFGSTAEVYHDGTSILKVLGRNTGQDHYLQVISQSGRRSAFLAAVLGDTSSRLALYGDATMAGIEFGPGNGARDTNLYRGGAGILQTDDIFIVGSGSRTNIRGVVCVPFAWTGTLSGTGTVDLPVLDSAVSAAQMRTPFAFEVIGLSVVLGSARTAGTLTAQVYNGSSLALVGMTATIDGTTTNYAQASDTVTGTSDVGGGSLFRMRITTSGFTPTANDVKVIAWLAHYAE